MRRKRRIRLELVWQQDTVRKIRIYQGDEYLGHLDLSGEPGGFSVLDARVSVEHAGDRAPSFLKLFGPQPTVKSCEARISEIEQRLTAVERMQATVRTFTLNSRPAHHCGICGIYVPADTLHSCAGAPPQ